MVETNHSVEQANIGRTELTVKLKTGFPTITHKTFDNKADQRPLRKTHRI